MNFYEWRMWEEGKLKVKLIDSLIDCFWISDGREREREREKRYEL